MIFGNGVKNIQAGAYNGARTVCQTKHDCNLALRDVGQPYIKGPLPVT